MRSQFKIVGVPTEGLDSVDYFQGVVAEYIRANRATFINPEFQLQLDGDPRCPPKDGYWYVDMLAVNLEEQVAYLCEVSYAKPPAALVKRLAAWSANWLRLVLALQRDAHIGEHWRVRPWLFVPEGSIGWLLDRLPRMPVVPKITPLEMTQPWLFCGFNQPMENAKPASIPVANW
jgi:hypothetical protein